MNTKGVSTRGPSARVITKSRSARIAALLFAGILAACGGGGGGGDGGGGGGPAPLVYSGNSSPAVITTSNAAQLTANVLGGANASGAISGVATEAESSGARELGRRLTSAVRATPLRPGSRPLTSDPVDQTEPCDSGSVRIFGDINQSGTGTLTFVWSNCRTGDSTLDGTGSVRVDAFEPGFEVITDGTFSFQRVTLTSPTASGTVSGSLRLQLSILANTETSTANLVTLDGNGRMTKSENFVVTDSYSNIFAPTSVSETITGRLFDSTHGFVDVITNAPFVFSTLTQSFPNSGDLVLTGANNRHVRAIAFSSNAVTLGLDLNGDNAFESAASLKWTELTSPAAADLADTDGDGMHNSWEIAKNFNPSNPADALLDTDGDGANNLAEYRAGSDPRDPTSVPSVQPPPPPPPPGPVPVPPPGGTPPAPAPEVGPPPTPIPGRVVPLAGVTDLVYDSVTQRIYASVQGNPGSPGSVVPIDPVTSTVGAGIPVGIAPTRLARSDDGQFLYVGLDGQSAFQRITLATSAVATFPLGNSAFCGARFVEDMQVLPGNPNAVAISRKRGGCSPRHDGVAIYDSGVARPVTSQDHTGSNVIEFSASSGTLYGYNNETTEFGFRRLTVDATGVSETSVFDSFDGNLIQGFGVDIRFGGGKIYTTNGQVVDPTVPSVLATFGLPGFGNLVVPDAGLDRVFFLSLDSLTSRWSLRAFDMTQVPPVRFGREDIANIAGNPGSLIRWGAKGLAFRTSGGQVILIESTALIP